jgi:hypothetical protein
MNDCGFASVTIQHCLFPKSKSVDSVAALHVIQRGGRAHACGGGLSDHGNSPASRLTTQFLPKIDMTHVKK